MKFRYHFHLTLFVTAVLLTGCTKGGRDYKQGTRAESLKDYDTALEHYNLALQAAPNNTEYKLKASRVRFEAGQAHVIQGRRLRDQANLQLAVAEFQKALMLDPSSPVAAQELQSTLAMIGARDNSQAAAQATPPSDQSRMMAGPPALQPLSRAPINMRATNDTRAIFDAVSKLAGLTVIFDPDFTSRRISVELTNVTLEQALNIVALQSRSFWRPVTNNIIFVAPDQPQKRRDYEEEVVRTFYLRNTVLPQELTEIVTSIRQLLDLRRVQQINSQNAIVIRDTMDRVLLAERIIDNIDKAKPEVVVQVAVMQARRDRLRNLGIQPGTSAAIAFSPPAASGATGAATGSGTTLNQLINDPHVFTNGYSVTIPGAVATFLMTDNSTQIIDNPEIRIVDGQTAKLRVGDRVPVATGSFQAGVGVGATGTGAGVINPLVNTQFQYLDVGVNVDVTPRIHQNHEISLKVNVVVSSVTGQQSIGGISQPIISQRSIEHDIRLKDGEVNILGGLIERVDQTTLTGWPGFAKIPFLRYFFSGETVNHQENEVMIVLIPHIVRLATITAENLRSIASGTDTNATVRLEDQVMSPPVPLAQSMPPLPAPAPGQPATPGAAQPPAAAAPTQAAQLRFEPGTVNLAVGQTATVGVVLENVQDLYSVPMLLQFNPAVISFEDVSQGGFLSGGTQEVAIVQRVDRERGQAIISATRMPNTPGVSGSGTLLGIVIKGVAAGESQISVLQVNPRDSKQRPLPLTSGQATVRVQ